MLPNSQPVGSGSTSGELTRKTPPFGRVTTTLARPFGFGFGPGTREQAKELLTVPDRTPLKGKCIAAILGLLVGCALCRAELPALRMESIQQREGRWVITDLHGKGGSIRTMAAPLWGKQLIEAWTAFPPSQQKRARSGD
jgi:integrase